MKFYSNTKDFLQENADENAYKTVTIMFRINAVKALLLIHLPIWCRIYASVNWVSTGSGNGAKPLPEQMLTYCQLDS